MELTVDLTQVRDHAIEILTDERLRDTLRYIAGPPISDDDWKTLAEAISYTRSRLEADPAVAERLVQTMD